MSDYEHKPGYGSLWVNDKKEKESQPNTKGKLVTPDGKTWEIAGWTKTGNGGKKYISLKASEPYQADGQQQTTPYTPDEKDDDIPF